MDSLTSHSGVPRRTTSIRKPSHSAPLSLSPSNIIRSPLSSSPNMLSNDARLRAVAALDSSNPPVPMSPTGHSAIQPPFSPSSRNELDDNDSDIGYTSSNSFVLAPNHRPSTSDFSTIAQHLSLNRSQSKPLVNSHNKLSTPEQLAAAKADNCIQNGIQLHEQLQLTESTREFERAAKLGSPTGMYLFGIALRSGWGVPRDEIKSFEYLSRAADLALRQASGVKSNDDRDAGSRELTLAIYELGQSFRNGWGVKKDRRTGVHYLQIAANLGDPDAQVDVATAFMNGDGVKRDKVTAARYFRLASNNGFKAPGMTWIWKTKYDVTGVNQLVSSLPTPK